MERYHREPGASPLVQSASLPLLLCLGQTRVPLRSPSRVAPGRGSDPAVSPSAPAVPARRSPARPAARGTVSSTPHYARSGFLQSSRRLLGKTAPTLVLSMLHVWVAEHRWQEESGELSSGRNQDRSRLPLREQLAQAAPSEARSAAALHGFLHQLSLSVLPISLWTAVSNSSVSAARWGRDRMGPQPGAALQKLTLLWFVVGESHTSLINRWNRKHAPRKTILGEQV